ncbi:MAG TPA: type II toxin-antitoxin system Phd/YefM family antitoxin [Gammaproteobacteria bacterium]|nr:type II toxin-antitoxin system Phd/YefM family antitoxin [Gammaproteobacteria bacterium]
MVITANDLKTRGIASLEQGLKDNLEATITVRGKEEFVVMRIEQYHYLREMELEAALAETRKDLRSGKFEKESAIDHVARIDPA